MKDYANMPLADLLDAAADAVGYNPPDYIPALAHELERRANELRKYEANEVNT